MIKIIFILNSFFPYFRSEQKFRRFLGITIMMVDKIRANAEVFWAHLMDRTNLETIS